MPNEPEFFSHVPQEEQPDNKPAVPQSLPHLPHLPSLYFAKPGGARSPTTIHLALTDCDHNTETLSGLTAFLGNLTAAAYHPPLMPPDAPEEVSITLVTMETCPLILPQLIAATQAAGGTSAFVHSLRHLFGVLDQVVAVYFADVFEQAGEVEYATALRRAVTGDDPNYTAKLEAALRSLGKCLGCESDDEVEVLLRRLKESQSDDHHVEEEKA